MIAKVFADTSETLMQAMKPMFFITLCNQNTKEYYVKMMQCAVNKRLIPPPATCDSRMQGACFPFGTNGWMLLGCSHLGKVLLHGNKKCGCGRSRNSGMAGAYERLYAIFYDRRMINCDFILSNLYVKNWNLLTTLHINRLFFDSCFGKIGNFFDEAIKSEIK